jgi:hypothetical protein
MTEAYQRFIILGDARTGSNMVAGALNTHPQIRCFREIFHFMQEYVDYNVEGYDPYDAADFALRAADPVRFLRERIFCDQPEGIRAVGFKYLYPHFWGFDGLIPHLTADTNLFVIHLKRRNWLRVLVSVRLAEASGKWIEDWGIAHAPRPLVPRALSAALHPARTVARWRGRQQEKRERAEEKSGLVLTPQECEDWFERSRREEARGDAIAEGHPTLQVSYQDLLEHREAEFARIEDFLGVERAKLVVSAQRQNPEPLRTLIHNYDELRGAFAGTLYEPWFEA